MSESKPTRHVIVVAFDFTEQAECALEMAMKIAAGNESAALHVLSVLEEHRGFAKVVPGKRPDYETAESVRTELQAVVRAALPEPPKPVPQDLRLFSHVRIGDPSEETLQLAAEAGAALIVVGTRGRSGAKRWVLGSVAERTVRHARCPVLVARPEHYDPADANDFQPEPACAKCAAVRAESAGAQWWCEDHASEYVPPHRYSVHRDNVSDHAGSILW